MNSLSLLQNLISSIEINTASGPPIVLTDPFAPGNAPPGPGLEQQQQPQLVIHFSDGSGPIVLNPWGPPPPTTWYRNVTLAEIGVAVLLPLALYGAIQAFKNKKARKAKE